MEHRIFGLESEFGVTFSFRGQRRLSPDEVARHLFRRVVHWGRSSNVFLENGARLYLDVGSHPEYATPECDALEDLVAQDKAGEWILWASSLRPGATPRGGHPRRGLPLQEQHRLGRQLLRLPRELPDRARRRARALREVLIPFLVTRQIYAGAGKVLQTAKGPLFCISQRAEHIWESSPRRRRGPARSSTPATSRTPTPSAYRRLHVIVGDSNMSEYATFLKVGATAIMLRDARGRLDGPSGPDLEDPIRAIREISQDLTCTTQGAARERPGDHRARDPDRVPRPRLRFAERRGLPPDLKTGARDVAALHHRARARPAVARSRGRLGHEAQARSSRSASATAFRSSHPMVSVVDLRYHDIDRDARALLQAAGPRARRAHRRPTRRSPRPRPCRPRRRGRGCGGSSCKAPRSGAATITVDWVHLKLNDQAQRTVLLKDPFKSHDERVERLIEAL